MKKEVIIHVGLPKTGTTFLQNNIFKNIEEINYIYGFKLFSILKDGKNLISDEGLYGWTNPPYPYDKSRVIAQRLKQLFPEAKIIVGIRNITTWKKSAYAQFVKAGGTLKYDGWEKKILDSYLDQKAYVKFIKSLFTDVYLYEREELKKNTEKIVKELCDFIGINVPSYTMVYKNIRMTKTQLNMCRIINKILHSDCNPKGMIPQTIFRSILEKIQGNDGYEVVR